MAAKLIVKPHTPVRTKVLWATGIILAAASLYLAFEIGRYRGGFDRIAASDERAQFLNQTADLENANQMLREQNALLRTSRDIDEQTYGEVEKTLDGLQSTIQAQSEDIAFYRSIVSPENAQRGLKIQDFEVAPGPQPQRYLVRLVLIQALKHDRRVSGVVDVSFDGARDGEVVSYNLRELSADPSESESLAYSFRYFQDFERELTLPSGFSPDRVTIEVRPSGRGAQAIRQSFDWSVQSS